MKARLSCRRREVAALLASDRDPENITLAIFPHLPNGRIGSRARDRPSSKDWTLRRVTLAFTARGGVCVGRKVGGRGVEIKVRRRRFDGRIRGNTPRAHPRQQ